MQKIKFLHVTKPVRKPVNTAFSDGLRGGVHGLAQIIENFIIPKKTGGNKGILWIIRVLLVFCFCSFAWIFFAANSISDAVYIITHMLEGSSSLVAYLHNGFSSIDLGVKPLFFLVLSIMILVAFDYFSLKSDVIKAISEKKTIVRWVIYTVFLLWMIFNIPTTNATEFIYFQF